MAGDQDYYRRQEIKKKLPSYVATICQCLENQH